MAFSEFTGIDHPAIAVSDVDAVSKWYVEVLGFEQIVRTDRPVCILKAPDGTMLEVMPQDDTPRPERTTHTPGWSHLALRVNDFDAAEAYLDGKGVEWLGEKIGAVGGGTLRSFADPEGNMLQIVAR